MSAYHRRKVVTSSEARRRPPCRSMLAVPHPGEEKSDCASARGQGGKLERQRSGCRARERQHDKQDIHRENPRNDVAHRPTTFGRELVEMAPVRLNDVFATGCALEQ